eukprot:5797772-Amphidinium_carterae.1
MEKIQRPKTKAKTAQRNQTTRRRAIDHDRKHGDICFFRPLVSETEDAKNMIAQLSGMDRSEIALVDTGFGTTTCPEHYDVTTCQIALSLLDASRLPTFKFGAERSRRCHIGS